MYDNAILVPLDTTQTINIDGKQYLVVKLDEIVTQSVNADRQKSSIRDGATTFASARTGAAYYFFNADSLGTLALRYQPAGVAGQVPPRGLSLTVRSGDGPPSQVVAGVGGTYADQPAPPRGFESTSLRLLRGSGATTSGRGRELIEAYEAIGREGYQFDLSLHSQPGVALTFHAENAHLFAGQRIALVDPRLGKRYDLDVESTVHLNPDASRTELTLFIGSDAYIAEAVRGMAPASVVLTQNYPNPFSSGTIIEYAIPEPLHVKLVVYDALGRLVDVLVDAEREAGFHTVRWDRTGGASYPVRSGLYLYRLEAGGVHVVRSMTVIR